MGHLSFIFQNEAGPANFAAGDGKSAVSDGMARMREVVASHQFLRNLRVEDFRQRVREELTTTGGELETRDEDRQDQVRRGMSLKVSKAKYFGK